MCAVEYEEEGAKDEDIVTLDEDYEYDEDEDETFDFVSENEEEEYEGSLMSFEDVDYPLPDEDMSEIALCAITFPNSMKLSLDPNVWIADTGAAVHATPNYSAMIKKSERNGNDSVTMGNGKSEATEWYGDLHVTLCDMDGNTKG
jgi:sugar lactone lactonase YvrE